MQLNATSFEAQNWEYMQNLKYIWTPPYNPLNASAMGACLDVLNKLLPSSFRFFSCS
jgi:hypothetical protein